MKKTMKFWDLVALEVGMTIGAGIFIYMPIASQSAGVGTIMAFVVAFVPMSIIMINVMLLGSTLPTTGGTFKYGAFLFSPKVAFLGLWAYLFGAFVGLFPLNALALASYMKGIWDGISLVPVALIILTFFYVVNLMGLKMASRVEIISVALLFIAIAIYTVPGIGRIEASNFEGVFAKGIGSIIYASALLTFTFAGSNAVIELGGEVENAKKNLPLSVIFSLTVVLTCYLLMAAVSFGIGGKLLEGGTLNDVASNYLSGFLFYVFAFGGPILAIATTINATYMWGTRSLLALCKLRVFPSKLGLVNKRGTPWVLLTIIWLLSSIMLISVGESGLNLFAAFASIGGIAVIIPTMFAVFKLKKNETLRKMAPAIVKKKWFIFIPILGVVFSIVIMLILLYQVGVDFSTSFFLFFIVWEVIGMIYFIFRLRYLDRMEKNVFSENDLSVFDD
ncbi:MAG: APC family permease [Mesotoga sp.]|uniref:APC family permease n=2 Tax=Mesotoga sp. TaxID=2053577 RepID=UPI00262193B9|nr:APC family permease [Mesotoga sp.]MDD3682073.1 APC family permease [Mesotoga sp.]MDD4826100.1 APC family permease [Mesotoga sp.]